MGGVADEHDGEQRVRTQALSFGAVAGRYAQVRPTYPAQAVDWLLEGLRGAFGERPLRVADIGAGAGALTARLAERRLGLLWNQRDHDVPWMAALGDLLAPAAGMGDRADDPRIGPPLVDAERFTTDSWTHDLTPEDVVGLAASRSYVITAEPRERQRVLDAVAELLATQPDTRGLDRVPVPCTTTCWRARRP